MDTSETYYKMCSQAFPEDAEEGIALKTQDQLQEMVKHKSPQMLASFYNRLGCPNISWDQLWLAFVMKGKYNKTWNGEEWQN